MTTSLDRGQPSSSIQFQSSCPASSESSMPIKIDNNVVEYIPGCTAAHMELIRKGFVDASGKITELFLTQKLPSLNRKEIERFRSLCSWEASTTITLGEALLHFEQEHKETIRGPIAFGGCIKYGIGWKYYCRALVSFGIAKSIAKSFFTASVIQEWERRPFDVDFLYYVDRLFVGKSETFVFDMITNAFDVRLKQLWAEKQPPVTEEEFRKKNFRRRETTRFTQEDKALNISMSRADFVFCHQSKVEYLGGHHALRLPSEVLLMDAVPDDIEIRPYSHEIHPLQAFVDLILKFLNPNPLMDYNAWFRQMHDMKNGYRITTESLRNWLRAFNLNTDLSNTGKQPFGKFVYDNLVKCERSHPSWHPAGIFFNALNATLILGENLNVQETGVLWQSFGEDDVKNLETFHPAFHSLHQMFVSEDPKLRLLPGVLLELCSLVLEVHADETENGAQHTNFVYTGADGALSFQLTFPTEEGCSLHVQLQTSPNEAYKQLYELCEELQDDTLVLNFLSSFLGSHFLNGNRKSDLAAHWKTLGFDVQTLRSLVIQRLHHKSRVIIILNFYLLMTVHHLRPVKASEMALIELYPVIAVLGILPDNHLQSIFQNVMGSDYATIVESFNKNKTNAKNPYVTWIAAFVQRNNLFAITKLIQVFMRFQKFFPADQELYKNIIAKTLEVMGQKFPEQAIDLLNQLIEQANELDIYYFTRYCQVVFPILNDKALVTKKLEVLGLILLKLTSSDLGEVKTTMIRSKVLLCIIEELLESSHRDIGITILQLITTDHPFYKILGEHLHSLLEKLAPPPIDIPIVEIPAPSLPQSFLRESALIRGHLENKRLQSAVNEVVALLKIEHPLHLEGAVLDVVVPVWTALVEALKNPAPGHVVMAISLIHQNGFQRLFSTSYFEHYLFLIEKMLQLPTLLRTETIQSFLLHTLSKFYTRIPPEFLSVYCCRLIELLPYAWSVTVPLTTAGVKVIEQHAFEMLRIVDFTEPLQVLLIIQLDKLGIAIVSNASEGLYFMNILQKALAVMQKPDELAALNLIKRLYNQHHISMPLDLLITVWDRCFINNLTTVGIEWINQLMEFPFDVIVTRRKELISGFPLWLLKIQQANKPEALRAMLNIYRKLDGPTIALEPLLTDDFIKANVNFIIDYPLKMFFESNPEKRATFVEAVATHLVKQKANSENELRKCLELFVEERITNPELWVLALKKAGAVKNQSFKAYAFQMLVIATRRGFFKGHDVRRIECWKLAVKDSTVIPDKLALEWIADGTELIEVFYLHEKSVVSPELIAFYMHLYRLAGQKLTDGLCHQMTTIHKDVCELFSSAADVDKCWELDSVLLAVVEEHMTIEIFEKLTEIINRRLFLAKVPLAIGNEAMNVLFRIVKVKFSHADQPDPAEKFLITITTAFRRELWTLAYLCGCCEADQLERLDLLKSLILQVFEAHQICVEENAHISNFPKTKAFFQECLSKLITHMGAIAPKWCLELLTDARVNVFLGKAVDTLIAELMEVLFSSESHPLEPIIDRENVISIRRGELDLFLDVFFAAYPQLSVVWQESLWIKSVIRTVVHIDDFRDIAYSVNTFIRICQFEFGEEKNETNFYDQIKKLIKLLFSLKYRSRADMALVITHAVIDQLLTESENRNFVDIEHVGRLADYFCFELEGVPQANLFSYRKRVKKLTDRFYSLSKQYPNEPYLQRCLSLKGVAFPKAYLLRQAGSQSSDVLFDCLDRICPNEPTPELSLNFFLKAQLVYLNNIKANPSMSYQGKSLVERMNSVFSVFWRSQIADGNLDKLRIAKEIALILIDITEKYVRSEDIKKKNSYSKVSHLIEITKTLLRMGVFKNSPEEYWKICIRHQQYLLLILAEKPLYISNIMISALHLTDQDAEIYAPPHSDYLRQVRANILQNLVFDQESQVQLEMQALLFIMHTKGEPWVESHPDKERINALIQRVEVFMGSSNQLSIISCSSSQVLTQIQ